jgi:predicted site-specific integrase-resolvase
MSTPSRVKASEAAQYYGISISNVRKWARDGTIPTIQTPTGRYIYLLPPPDHFISDDENGGENIIYSRVSSRKQFGDLQNQTRLLKEKYPNYKSIQDIGSGINYKRQGFITILEQLFQRKVKRVVVSHQDRFSRFGFEFFQWLFQQFGAVLESMEHHASNTGEDMVADIMEIFTVFTARYYGSRKYRSKLKIKNLPK